MKKLSNTEAELKNNVAYKNMHVFYNLSHKSDTPWRYNKQE